MNDDDWNWLVDMCIWHEATDPYEVNEDEQEKQKPEDDKI